MDFSIETYATLVGHTNDDGKKHYFPTYHIDIDGDCIADEYHEHNLTPETVAHAIEASEQAISQEISRIIASRLAHSIVSPTKVRVEACVELQAWVRDYATYVRDDVFDCELALDTISLSELPSEADGFSDGACNYGDDVFETAMSLGLTDSWNGPWYFRIPDYDAYDRYIAARIRNDYGYELRG